MQTPNLWPLAVSFDEDSLTVRLSDGRKISAPLAWFPRLLHASPEQLAQVELSRHGLHCDALDEGFSSTSPMSGCICACLSRDFAT